MCKARQACRTAWQRGERADGPAASRRPAARLASLTSSPLCRPTQLNPSWLACAPLTLPLHPRAPSNHARVGPSIRSPPLPPYIKTDLTFLEYDADWGLAARRSYRLDGFAFLHDMAVTRNYYVLFQNPVTGALPRCRAVRGASETRAWGAPPQRNSAARRPPTCTIPPTHPPINPLPCFASIHSG